MHYSCYNCKTPLCADNRSEEHIIQNSIGGILTSRHLLCNKCNKAFGSTIDAEFATQFDSLTALLNLKRDRKKDYVIKNVKARSGKPYHLYEGRTPVPVKPTIEVHPDHVYINARSEKELHHILKKLKKKIPHLDISNAAEKFSWHDEYLQEPVSIPMVMGGEGYFKGITKIAVNAYLHFGGDSRYIENAIKSIHSTDPYIAVARWFYPEEVLHFSSNEVSHLIYVKGCPKQKTLQVFIMLFSSYGAIVDLCDPYEGRPFEHVYCYDVLRCQVLEKPDRIDLKSSTADPSIINRRYINNLQENLNRLMRIIDHRHVKDSSDELGRRVSEDVLSKYPDGTMLTEAIAKEIAHEAALRYTLFLHQLQLRNQYHEGDAE